MGGSVVGCHVAETMLVIAVSVAVVVAISLCGKQSRRVHTQKLEEAVEMPHKDGGRLRLREEDEVLEVREKTVNG